VFFAIIFVVVVVVVVGLCEFVKRKRNILSILNEKHLDISQQRESDSSKDDLIIKC
jgi:hypothetical protein